ncbi:MAG: HAD family hydrolase [Pseudomonadota bacterium]
MQDPARPNAMPPIGETRAGASRDPLPPALEGIEAVAFDAFGTLVEIRDRRRAFVPLLRALEEGARRALTHRLMREARAVDAWPEALGIAVDPAVIEEVAARVAAEAASVALRAPIPAVWCRLRDAGLPLALCSNLASPYTRPLLRALPDRPEVVVFSCSVGAIKPEPAIYARVTDGLGLPPGRVLFVGDTPRADIDGPRAAGMRALHIDALVSALMP